jgi:serine/threonine protein kinase/Tfp pilus assembly protein PilF
MNATNQSCPSAKQLERYLNSSLNLGDAASVENHVEQCSECEVRLQSLLDGHSFFTKGKSFADPGQPVNLGDSEGRYEHLERLGSGGFGTIWKMRDTKFNRLVAVKVMKPERASNPSLVRRFLAEAQICSQLSHPSIVPIHDMGVFADGRAYFAMKLIEGRGLDEAFGASDSVMEKVNAFASLCQAVAYAHERGVIHRDLKPQNVMVGAHGEIQLIDWGLAKAIGEPETESAQSVGDSFRLEFDQTQTALGTVAYMAPEQLEDAGAADKRCDVFSLGAILCKLLTGDAVFRADDKQVPEAISKSDFSDAYERLQNCSADPRIIKLATGCLSANPDNRPPHAGALSTRVQEILRAFDQEAEEQRVAVVEMELRHQESRKRSRLRWSLAAIATLAAVIVGGMLWTRHVEQKANLSRAEQLKNAAEEAFAKGDFASAAQQVALADDAMPESSASLEKLSQDIDLCEKLDQVFQEQAASHAVRHMGIVVSTREQNAAKIRALKQYDEFLADPMSLLNRFENSSGKAWLASALGNRAWLLSQFRPEEKEQLDACLETASQLDDDNEISAFLYDSANWNDPAAVAEELQSKSSIASPGALSLATEVLIKGNVDPAMIRDIVAQRRDNFGLNLRWSSKLAYRDSATGLQFAQVAASLRPQSLTAQLNLATLYWVTGDNSSALRECREVLDQDGTNVRAQILLADLLQEADEHEKATAAYQRAIELGTQDQDVIPLVKLGNLHRREDKTSKEALEKFNEALEIDPDSAFALYHKGQHLDESGKPEQAIELYRKALKLQPDYSFVHNNLGKSLITRYIRGRNDDLAGAIKFRNEAQSHFLKATQLDPENVWAHTNLGNTYNDEGKVDEAIACFRKALKLNPKHHGAGFNLANTLLNDSRFMDALEAAQLFIEQYPESDIGWYVAGIAEVSLNRPDDALNSLKQSVRFAEAKGRSADGQKEMLKEIEDEIGLENLFAAPVAAAMIETADPVVAARMLQGKGWHRTAFLTLIEGMEAKPELLSPRLTMRAARFGVAAAVAAPSNELAYQYLIDAAAAFSDCLDLVKDGFKEDFTAEEFLTNARMTIVDTVERDSLSDYPDNVRKAWTEIHDRLDALQATQPESGSE